MLDGIDDINWAKLGHAYGTAKDVPGQIRALRSAEAQTREKALHDLYGNIFHQGTVYEATAYAVPFLLELAADPGTPDRAEVAGLLSAIAIGYDSNWLPDTVPIAEIRATAEGGEAVLAAAPAPRDFEDEDSDEDEDEDDEDEDEDEDGEEEYSFYHLPEADQNKLYAFFFVRAYDAVRAGVPVFLDLLCEPDSQLQAMAAYALGWFPEEAATILPRLTGSAFDSQAAQATALVSVGLLGGRPDPALLRDPRPLVRWGAAVALRDSDELVAWVTGDAGTNEQVPFLDGDLGGLASLVLGRLGADAAFDALLARIPKVSGVEALRPVGEALRLAFPDGRLPDGTPLEGRQLTLARVLADSPGTWLYDGMTFGNFSGLVGEYGLPRSCEKLRAFLGAGQG